MAQDIYLSSGNISSWVLNSSKSYIDDLVASLSSLSAMSTASYRDAAGSHSLYSSSITAEASSLLRKANSISDKLERYSSIMNTGPDELSDADGQFKNELTTWWGRARYTAGEKWSVFQEEFGKNYGWKEILKGAGYAGNIYNLATGFKNANNLGDYADVTGDLLEFITKASTTYRNYKQIGNAVGGSTAQAWWLKSITGLNKLGRASTAKNPVTRFTNNLTNKTSYFNGQIRNVIGNFTGANGVGKAISAYGAVAMTAVANTFSNIEEQKESGGKMSDGRVIAESVTETVVDTVLSYGASIVVGAAVAAVAPAAPAIAVVAVSGAVVAGINAGVKAVTGKTTTEWISDSILDGSIAVGKAAKKLTEKVSDTVGGWFHKLSYA